MDIHAIQRDLVRFTGKIVRSDKTEVHPENGEILSQAAKLRELMKDYCTYQLPFDIKLKCDAPFFS